MHVKLSSIRKLLFSVALIVTGCRGASSDSSLQDAGPAPSASASAVARAPALPFAPLSGDPAKRALEVHAALIKRLSQGAISLTDPDYLVFRRSLAAGAPLWRRREMLAGEVIFGPLRSVDEAGGALARLDVALVRADSQATREALDTLSAPLRLFVETSKTVPFASSIVAQVLSSAAYDLGLVALESTSGLADGLPAVIADCQGTLDFVDRGAALLAGTATGKTDEALTAVKAHVASLRERLDRAVSSGVFDDRASFVLLTGKLGVSLRRLAGVAGLFTRPPYRARVATASVDIDEPVSALTIPARNLADASADAYVELGRALFFDKRLSAGGVRACVTCHSPDKGLSDGQARPASLDPSVKLRHTPTLLYGTLQAGYLWDGRVLTAERQALGVIHAKAEMGLSDADIVRVLQGADDLRPLVAALAPAQLTPDLVARALAAFQAHAFVPADADIDRFARGDEGALSAAVRAGFDVFVGKARCARCHIPPTFGGSRPRDFAVPVFAVLGVPTSPESTTIDPDLGRGSVTHREADQHAFKTPTVRNVARTAPYFHHGAFRTLEQVVDFYDRGGGRGLGLSVPNQDPDVRKLSLSSDEKRVLLEFMRVALLDATPPDKLVKKAR
jgi:cytochrome c peroxidase